MPDRPHPPLLDRITTPADLRAFSDQELGLLAEELRQETISAVSETGGHLGAGLGVVELTVALHAVWDTPKDKLIWDVSHQSYPHKILTGRRDRIRTLRQEGGLSGFTKRDESPFDPFGTAHSSTSISAALGFAVASDNDAPCETGQGDAIAVIGDGALSAGMAFEALNNAGALQTRLFVILNDNAMSIAPPTGALASYLSQLDGAAPRTLFDDLGVAYHGPLDGHDLPKLLDQFRTLKETATGPVLVHVRTRKGKGYLPAERAADKGHGMDKFDVSTGEQKKAKSNRPSFSAIFGQTLTSLAHADPRICAVTAAMPDGTGLKPFGLAHPDRLFDVGIAEQHAVTFSAGLAAGGLRPFCALYSTFLQRGYDQIVHDVAIQRLPVRFAIDRAGLVGADGATHAGSFDIAFLANVPGFVVMAAADEAELVHMLTTAAQYDAGPIAVRYPRGHGPGAAVPERGDVLDIGRGRVIRTGQDIAFLSFGTRLAHVERAADSLAEIGFSVTVADARFAKPLDKALIDDLAANHRALFTIEEGAAGGFGAHVVQHLLDGDALARGLRVKCLTLPDRFIDHAAPDAMYSQAQLDADALVAAARSILA